MANGVKKIDFSRKRIAHLADKYYNEGKFLPALRLAYKELLEYGGDPDVYARFADIYEAMGLQGSAVNCYFRFLDVAEEQDLPDIYEGLAANFLSIGNESQSAFYYNKLIDVDDTLPDETKFDIAEAFSAAKKDKFRFIYPPKLADYSKEMSVGSKALKAGDCRRAIDEFSKVERGAKEYASAKEMQAVAHLLAGETELAEQACKELLSVSPDDVRAQATLAAVYLEQGRKDESRALAEKLAAEEQDNADDLYKVATVCCENDMHEQAYQKFKLLEKKMPYDGRMLYFKAVAAYKSGRLAAAEKALDDLCTVYTDAEVAKYYLKELRAYRRDLEESGGTGRDEQENERPTPPEFTYFYHLPQEEREQRCASLLKIGDCPKDEAQIFGLLALHDGYFQWCFDEMDGGDHDLQYLGLVTAIHVGADEFVRDVLLDFEVADVLKIEALRLLLERNEDLDVGLVLCSIYRRVPLLRIKIGRKRRKKFVESYAKVASKFVAISDMHGKKIAAAAEKLYRALEKHDALDLVDKDDDCACAIFLLSGIKELGRDKAMIASAFDANLDRVHVLMSYVVTDGMSPQAANPPQEQPTKTQEDKTEDNGENT
ncbi:MAG: tetratricopeptide repeat protein [Clostridia bacterium]|nr:tetratricopeptide repeat protein [Clostridia bacterium]